MAQRPQPPPDGHWLSTTMPSESRSAVAVTAISIYAIVIPGTSSPPDTIAFAVIALLCNPVVPVRLPKAVWAIIDLVQFGPSFAVPSLRSVRSTRPRRLPELLA